jgi:hypothetical protein
MMLACFLSPVYALFGNPNIHMVFAWSEILIVRFCYSVGPLALSLYLTNALCVPSSPATPVIDLFPPTPSSFFQTKKCLHAFFFEAKEKKKKRVL